MTEKEIENLEKSLEEAVKECIKKDFENQCPIFKNKENI